MINKCMEKNEDVINLNKEIDEIGKTYDIWHLEYYLGRIHERYDILITNRDVEIQNLKDRIEELEKYEINDKNIEKVIINLKYDRPSRRVRLYSNSKRYDPIFDEYGRKWFIPKLSDDSYIKIKFIGEDVCGQGGHKNEDDPTYISGLSTSSGIIGNTVFGKGKFKDIRDNFILDKRTLSLLLISPSVWFYVLRGTEKIEIIGSSNDIDASLDVI